MSVVFITGTGTDVGKTYVTSNLIIALRSRGKLVRAIKPVATGFDPDRPLGSDPAVLLKALGREVCQAEIERVSLLRFRAPLSPDMAARLENRTIDFSSVCDFCQAAAESNDGPLLIEGIGGIMVPLTKTKTTLDLMINLRLPLILVAGSYLGSISHLLSTLDTLQHHGLYPLATIINETDGSSVPAGELLETLASFVKTPLLLLHYKNDEHNNAIFEQLLDLAQL